MQLDAFWIWMGAGALLFALEIVVPGAILSFLGLAALTVGALVKFDIIDGWLTATTTWFILSIAYILVLRSFVLRWMPSDFRVQNTDEDKDDLGSIVEVVERVAAAKKGRIRFRDTTWSAYSEEGTFEPGDKAVICGRRGNSYVVKKIS